MARRKKPPLASPATEANGGHPKRGTKGEADARTASRISPTLELLSQLGKKVKAGASLRLPIKNYQEAVVV